MLLKCGSLHRAPQASLLCSAYMASLRTLSQTEVPSSRPRYGMHSARLLVPCPASPLDSTPSSMGSQSGQTRRWKQPSVASPTPVPPPGAPSFLRSNTHITPLSMPLLAYPHSWLHWDISRPCSRNWRVKSRSRQSRPTCTGVGALGSAHAQRSSAHPPAPSCRPTSTAYLPPSTLPDRGCGSGQKTLP